MKFHYFFPAILLAIMTLASCDSNKVFEENIEIPSMVWDANEKVTFQVDIIDTVNLHNFYLNLRHADNYPYSNLFIFIETLFPNGISAKDTLECILSDETGAWLGSGLGDIWDNQLLFKRNVRFPMSGKYVFAIEQAMRVNQLPMVMDVGLRIERQEEKK